MATRNLKYKNTNYNYKKVRNKKRKQNTIPTFSYRSAFIIVLSAALASFFLPYIFSFLPVDTRLITLLSSAIFISLAVCYCHYFIETDKGFGKSCIRLFICFFIAISIISYFWLYIGLYM